MANTSPKDRAGAMGPETRGGPYYEDPRRPEQGAGYPEGQYGPEGRYGPEARYGPPQGEYPPGQYGPAQGQYGPAQGYAPSGQYGPVQGQYGPAGQYGPPGQYGPGHDQVPAHYAQGASAPAAGQAANRSDGRRSWEELAIADDEEAWKARTRVFLTPIAAPSIMGLFGFMIATGMVGAWQAGWYGNGTTPLILFPFALVAGGVLQSVAAFYSFRARDGVAVAVHTTWGSFWVAWGIMQVVVLSHAMAPIALGTVNDSFGMWFVVLTVITLSAAFASTAQSTMLTLVLGTLGAGSALTAVGFFAGSLGVTRAGGWLFVCSAAIAWLTASAMMFENAFGRTIIPLGKWSKEANVPGRQATRPLAYPAGMPGVRVGQ